MWSSRYSDDLRNLRLGIFTLEQTEADLQLLSDGAGSVLFLMQRLTPPPQLQRAHELHVAATAEYRDGYRLSIAALAGDTAAYGSALAHLDNADALRGQAMAAMR